MAKKSLTDDELRDMPRPRSLMTREQFDATIAALDQAITSAKTHRDYLVATYPEYTEPE